MLWSISCNTKMFALQQKKDARCFYTFCLPLTRLCIRCVGKSDEWNVKGYFYVAYCHLDQFNMRFYRLIKTKAWNIYRFQAFSSISQALVIATEYDNFWLYKKKTLDDLKRLQCEHKQIKVELDAGKDLLLSNCGADMDDYFIRERRLNRWHINQYLNVEKKRFHQKTKVGRTMLQNFPPPPCSLHPPLEPGYRGCQRTPVRSDSSLAS